MKGLVGEEKLEDLRLMVTEAVTNSVRHASLGFEDEIQLEIQVSEGTIRGEVTDAGPGFEKPDLEEKPQLSPDGSGTSGWGLYMIERLSTRWGVERGDHTRVWFEIEDRSTGI